MDVDLLTVEQDRLGQAGQEPVADAPGGRLAAVDDDGELVPAEPGDEVTAAHAGAQPLGDGEQQLVAGRVPAGVVDVLEVVEVDEQDADVVASGQGAGEELLQQRAVRQPRQRVAQPLLLVEPPGGEVGDAGGEDERRVDDHPAPGVVHRRVVAVDEPGFEGAEDAVVHDDDEEPDREGHPVLVERHQTDHHEEVEVRLGLPVPELHQDGGGGEQAG